MINKTVCFSGHRPEKLPGKGSTDRPETEFIRNLLREKINTCISEGYTRFLSGVARGIDLWAAQTVLELRERYPAIRLELVLPCPSQPDRWQAQDVAVYKEIRALADEVHYVSGTYFTGVLQLRNRKLVENAAVCIGYLTDSHTHSGGTAYTVLQALNGGAEFINLAE